MTSPSALRRRSLSAVVAAVLLALAAVLLPALPASAHDELVSSDPGADAVLDALPSQLTLSFSADVLTDAGATVIEVTDAAGTRLDDGAPQVAGTEVTQALTGEASGAVTVLWRVVSSDGHPIDGDFSFSVPVAASTPTPTPQATTAVPTPSAEASRAPAETAPATAAPAETASATSPLPWILLAVALVVVAGVLVYVFAARGRGNTADRGTSGR